MGAKSIWKVNVIKTIETQIEVDAITGQEAMEEAEKIPGVIKALSYENPFYEE